MTKKDVKYAIQRGLGRGYLAVREDPERYRDLVLWACGRNLAFDPQCEGTRSWYDYQLILCYPDQTEFRDLVMDRLQAKKPDRAWDYAHFSELLSYFAMDGDRTAEDALWAKYREFLARIRGIRRRGRPLRQTRECLEVLGLSLSWRAENYAAIAADLGALFRKNTLLDGWAFAWLYGSRPESYNRQLRKRAANSPDLTAWFAAMDALEEEKTSVAGIPRESPPPTGGRRLSVYLKWKKPELAPSYAEAYLEASDPSARAEALEAFFVCPYPFDPAPILKDAESEHPALRAAARNALAEIRDPRVRRFAWDHMEDAPAEMLPIAVKNYLPKDDTLLRPWLQRLSVDYACKSNWHTIHTAVLRLFVRDSGVDAPPKSLLPLVYETTLCSYCRERAAWRMRRYRMIAPELWEEQQYDANDEIRHAAEVHFRRQTSAGKGTPDV